MEFIKHEFEITLDYLLPGMVLSRDLVHKGTTLLKYNTVLDDDLIEKVRSLGVKSISVYFDDADVGLLKDLFLMHDDEPGKDKLIQGFIDLLNLGLHGWAHPRFLCRDPQVIPVVEQVLAHIFEIITRSSRAFNLLRESRFFRHPQLSHCQLTAIYSLIIGVEMDYNIPALIDLGLSGIFYDIGKIKVSQDILNKPGRLSEQEFAEVKKHCYFGKQMLAGLSKSFPTLERVAIEHHENYYGGGYPRNIRGDNIHPFSQIVSLADKFAAMLTPKDYREPFQPHEAFERVVGLTRSSVAPHVFKAFTRSVLVYPRRCLLKLSSGAIGVVIDSPTDKPLFPTLEMVYSEDGKAYVGKRPRIEMADHPELSILSFFQPTLGA